MRTLETPIPVPPAQPEGVDREIRVDGPLRVSSPQGLTVTISETGAEHWFMTLRAEFNDGRWARMCDRHRNLLPVLCELRDFKTGVAYAPMVDWTGSDGVIKPGLLKRTGMGKSAIYQTINEFCVQIEHLPYDAPDWAVAAAGHLDRRATHLYAVYPGRIFAGRRPQAPVQPGGKPQDELHPSGRSFHGGGRFSTGVDSNGAPAQENARASERIENSNSIDDESGQPDGGQRQRSVRMMTSGPGVPGMRGFGSADAERILAKTRASESDVRNAIANANQMLRWKKLTGTWTGYVKAQLENGVTLFRSIENEQDTKARVEEKLRRLAEAFGTEETCAALTPWFHSLTPKQISALVTSRAWRESDRAFWNHAVAHAMTGVRS